MVKSRNTLFFAVFVGALFLWISSSKMQHARNILTQINKDGGEFDLVAQVSNACKKLTQKNLTAFQEAASLKVSGHTTGWLISDRFKLMSCINKKVGHTNIARVMYTLEHLAEYNDSNKVAQLTARNKADKIITAGNKTKLDMKEFSTFTKFMFVRDPLERLLSAYRDHRPTAWFKPGAMPFQKFLERIIDTPDIKLNPHHVQFYRTCNPCVIKFDFISMLANFDKDMQTILKSVGVQEQIILPQRDSTGYKQESSAKVSETFIKEVPTSLIEKIYEKYFWDYYLFGFKKSRV